MIQHISLPAISLSILSKRNLLGVCTETWTCSSFSTLSVIFTVCLVHVVQLVSLTVVGEGNFRVSDWWILRPNLDQLQKNATLQLPAAKRISYPTKLAHCRSKWTTKAVGKNLVICCAKADEVTRVHSMWTSRRRYVGCRSVHASNIIYPTLKKKFFTNFRTLSSQAWLVSW